MYFENYRSEVRAEFPIVEDLKRIEHQTTFNNNEIKSQSIEHPLQKYWNADKRKSISLTHDHVLIETMDYISYREFQKDIELAVNTLLNLLKSIDFNRFGFRFINHIVLTSGNPFKWANYIDSSLVAVTEKFLQHDPNTARVMSQIVMNYGDYKLNLNFGMHNSEFPAKISRVVIYFKILTFTLSL